MGRPNETWVLPTPGGAVGSPRRLQPSLFCAHALPCDVPVVDDTPAQEHDPGGLCPVADVLDITVLGGSNQARLLEMSALLELLG